MTLLISFRKVEMYKFRDTVVHKNLYDEVFIPTSAMSYGGIFLEEYISGYQTLSVEGREMYSLDFETQDKRFGSVVTSVKYPSRTFTVNYKLTDRDPNILQNKFDKLLAYLVRDEDVKIVFNDDLEFFFKGRYQSSDIVSGDTNSIISTFTVFCSDPFKYGAYQSVPGKVLDNLAYPVKPKSVEVKMNSNALDATDGKYHLKVSLAKKDDILLFDFETGDTFINGVKNSGILDLDSDFKNIRIEKGTDFTSERYDIIINYRKAVL